MLLTSGLVERCFLLDLMVATERYNSAAKCQNAYFVHENRVFPFKNEVEGKYAFFTVPKTYKPKTEQNSSTQAESKKNTRKKKWRRRNKEKEERAKRFRNPRFHSDGYPPAEE